MIVLHDQVGNRLTLDRPARRIVSLVPSQTALLHHWGLERETVGITKFCIHPRKWWQSKTRVGGTKSLHIPTIQSLCPDVIIGNKEENTKADIRELQANHTVYVSDVKTLEDAYHMMHSLGRLCGKETSAAALIDQLRQDIRSMRKTAGRVLYLIWKNPYMACGTATFIHTVLETAGWTNVVQQERYVTITEEDIRRWQPDCIFLSSEPFPFRARHQADLAEVCRAKVCLVDGQVFSWYGAHQLKIKPYVEQLTDRLSQL